MRRAGDDPRGRRRARSSTTDALRTPALVRRGDVVTVYARSAGIRVRTAARARDDGSQGDLVSVESLLDRSTFFARVSGIREVEVYARSRASRRPRPAAGDRSSAVERR